MATILIIDDDPDARSILTTFLRSREFDVHEASSGPKGLKQLGDVDPDVVILDVMMPRMDGWEVARRIRRHPTHADVRIVMLTARDSREARREGAQAGADLYLVKPIGLDELADQITDILPDEHWSATPR